MEYTQLEKDVLDWMIDHLEGENLAEQIRAAVPITREYTGSGSFTTLSISKVVPHVMVTSPINGPAIVSEGIEFGGGALLFLNESGQIEALEMYPTTNCLNGQNRTIKIRLCLSNAVRKKRGWLTA